jgi:hypothetical protein
MKDNTKVFQDKKVPMDAKTQQTKNNSSNKEDNENDVREDRTKGAVNTKTSKTPEKLNAEKVKTFNAR